jgi:metalloprotein, YbeY/UPF0054 family
MKKLKLSLRCENGQKCLPEQRSRIEKAAGAVLKAENVEGLCELSVLLTDDEGIHAINKQFRDVDRATDVLSFPMGDVNPENGRLVLGDMVLNIDRVKAQGIEYGHGPEHELSYLTVHSVLHLLGYDHMDEGPEKAKMRAREKVVMEALGENESATTNQENK